MANRKDSKGRVLKTGESQRKDGTYMYRYTDIRGNRKSVYASDLKELREKEKDVQRDLDDGIDYAAGKITAICLIREYVKMKNNIKESTENTYLNTISTLDKYDILHKSVNQIKIADAKKLAHKLLEDGKNSNTVHQYIRLISSSFDMAYDDDIIRKNPFKIKASDYSKDDKKGRFAMTQEQQRDFLHFVLSNKKCNSHYDDYVILLGTGLRISEYLGLTIKDIDLAKRIMHINHQVVLCKNGKYKITTLKSKSGDRYLYIDDNIYGSIVRKIHTCNRRDKGFIIDGYSGFLNISHNGESIMRRETFNISLKSAVKRYNKQYPDKPLPNVTPHTLRHTFCTNMANAGLDLKSLQYLMGHSDTRVTLEVYTHVNVERATSEMKRIADIVNTNIKLEA